MTDLKGEYTRWIVMGLFNLIDFNSFNHVMQYARIMM